MSARSLVLLLVTAMSACAHDIVSSPPPPPPPPPTTVAVAYCTGLEPLWVAFEDGDGAWTRVQPAVSGANTTFRYEFAADRGAIAMVSRSGGMSIVSVLYGTPRELETAGDTNPRHCFPPTSKTLLGTAVGIDTTDVAFVGASFTQRVRVNLDHMFELKALPSGPRDLLAARFVQSTGVPTRFILRRDIDVPDSTTLPVLDFASAEAFAPAAANVSIDGLGAESATSGTRLFARHDEIAVTLQTNLSPNATRPYFAIPETQLAAGELQILSVGTSAGDTGSTRSTTLYFRAPTDRTLTLGATLSQPAFTTVAVAPSLRLRAHFDLQNDYDRATFISYQQGVTTFVTLEMTAAYAGLSAKGYDLVIPELGGADGFDPAWALRPDRALLWNAVRLGGTLGLGRNAVPADGSILRSVSAAGAL